MDGLTERLLAMARGASHEQQDYLEVIERVLDQRQVDFDALAAEALEIKIAKDKKNGIQCVKGRRIKFRGSKYISELDYQPEAKADFSHFWKYVPVSNKNSQLLLTAYMVNACFPDHEYPILHIEGPPGSGKTTTTECILEIIDPTSFGVAAPLTSPEDITLAAFHRHVPAFDNNGGILKPNLQNLLCQSSTGGKAIARKFLTNTDAVVVDLRKPIIFNEVVCETRNPSSSDNGLAVIGDHASVSVLSQIGDWNEFQDQYKA